MLLANTEVDSCTTFLTLITSMHYAITAKSKASSVRETQLASKLQKDFETMTRPQPLSN